MASFPFLPRHRLGLGKGWGRAVGGTATDVTWLWNPLLCLRAWALAMRPCLAGRGGVSAGSEHPHFCIPRPGRSSLFSQRLC